MSEMVETGSGLVVPAHVASAPTVDQGRGQSDRQAVAQYFDAMAKLEAHFPQLVKLAAKLKQMIDKVAQDKGIGTHTVILDVPRWHPPDMVVIRVGFDPEAQRDTTNDDAAKNFHHLRAINEACPQAVDVAMSIGYQLVPLLNQRRVMPSTVVVGAPMWQADGPAIHIKMTVPQGLDR